MDSLHLEPHCSPCYNYLRGNLEEKKTVWLVPLVVRQDRGKVVISWSCSFGQSCECANCIYAHAENKKRDVGSNPTSL